jgi:hypothetical protein
MSIGQALRSIAGQHGCSRRTSRQRRPRVVSKPGVEAERVLNHRLETLDVAEASESRNACAQIGDRRIVPRLVSRPSASFGVARFDLAKLTKELAWPGAAEDVEKTVPVGDVEQINDARGSIGKYRGSPNVGECDGSDDGMASGFGLRADRHR